MDKTVSRCVGRVAARLIDRATHAWSVRLQNLLLPTLLLPALLLLTSLFLTHPALAQGSPYSPSPTLQAIKDRGEIKIGIKTDFAPFGMLDGAGKPIGLELDLAQKLADELGVKLRPVRVTTENRFQRIEQGAVDLIIATAGDTRERRELATAIEPNYYGGGVTVLLAPDQKATNWQEIRGKTLCALQGAYFNRPVTQRYILNLQMYRSVRDAQLALRDGHCIGFLYTDVAIHHTLQQLEWAHYKAPFTSTFIIPWAISIARSERATEFERIVGDSVAKWHRDGSLIELEKHWQVRPGKFLQDAHALWNRKAADGSWLCKRDMQGLWPVECRNPAFVTSADVQGLRGQGIWLKEHLGINLSVVYDPFDGQRYLQGIAYTLALSGLSILGALLLGYLGAKLVLAEWFLLSRLCRFIMLYGRMTPPLLQMYLVFFGVGGTLWASHGMTISPFLIAVWCLSYYHGAIIVASLLDAAKLIKAKDPGFRLNLSTLPALMRISTVGIRSAISNLSKATTITSAIAVPELLAATIAIIADQGNVNVMMNLLLVTFYFVSALWLYMMLWAERKILGSRGAA